VTSFDSFCQRSDGDCLWCVHTVGLRLGRKLYRFRWRPRLDVNVSKGLTGGHLINTLPY